MGSNRGQTCQSASRPASPLGVPLRRGRRPRCIPPKQLHLRAQRPMLRPRDPLIATVWQQLPRLTRIAQTVMQLAQHALLMHLTLDRKSDLDAAEEVALHPVGAGAKQLRLAPVLEIAHTRVLEEPAHDRADRDVFRYSGYPRP